jgi:hypothetical protein
MDLHIAWVTRKARGRLLDGHALGIEAAEDATPNPKFLTSTSRN